MTSRQQTRIGLLGSGQLAQMLLESATQLDAVVTIYYGDAKDKAALKDFFKKNDLVLFESEFISCDLIASAAQGLAVKFLPSLEAMGLLQDKLEQKKILNRLQIPTSKYTAITSSENLESWLNEAFRTLGTECVLKWARLGYDGKGTFFANAKNAKDAIVFCQQALAKNIAVYAEEKIAFRRELAMVAVHSTNGEFLTYPLVISEQKNGICHQVQGPAKAFGVSATLEQQAAQSMQRLAKDLNLYGAFAFEFFETQDGALLVNEIAPRVHNTGHYTQDAATTSQFENHLRAATAMKLGATQTSPAFAMLNLLGPSGVNLKASPTQLPPVSPSLALHWYGKEDIRPGRKLGHLNVQANSTAELSGLVAKMKSWQDQWIENLKRDASR